MTDTLEYDATGLLCPLPVLRANRKLRELASGGLLTVRATDPATEQDFPAFCRQTGRNRRHIAIDVGQVLVADELRRIARHDTARLASAPAWRTRYRVCEC